MYFRPLCHSDPVRPKGAVPLAGGHAIWFDRAEAITRAGSQGIVPVAEIPEAVLDRLTAPRGAIAGVAMDQPRLMGILNVTPDSFSDGGAFFDPDHAVARARAMVTGGADILDIGGESTRPGADFVPAEAEIARVVPVIQAVAGLAPVSIDTRKAAVGQAALSAGAQVLNDVSALCFDAEMAGLAAQSGAPICLMHAQGDPKTMQTDPNYENVLLDVYDFLAQQIDTAVAAGVRRDQIIVDPGIGFGKTLDHNLTLLRNLSLFHALGCPVLLGASRKRFIGTLGQAPDPLARAPGSIAIALAAAAQGVQILRVHDIQETKQALRLWRAVTT